MGQKNRHPRVGALSAEERVRRSEKGLKRQHKYTAEQGPDSGRQAVSSWKGPGEGQGSHTADDPARWLRTCAGAFLQYSQRDRPQRPGVGDQGRRLRRGHLQASARQQPCMKVLLCQWPHWPCLTALPCTAPSLLRPTPHRNAVAAEWLAGAEISSIFCLQHTASLGKLWHWLAHQEGGGGPA